MSEERDDNVKKPEEGADGKAPGAEEERNDVKPETGAPHHAETDAADNGNQGGSGGDAEKDGFRDDSFRPPEQAAAGSKMKPDKPWRGIDVWKGIGLCALLHLLLLLVPVLYFGIGIVQFLYIIPALIICRNNTAMVQGLLIGAGITFLLNAACFGFVMIRLG